MQISIDTALRTIKRCLIPNGCVDNAARQQGRGFFVALRPPERFPVLKTGFNVKTHSVAAK
jgi:hypothetical protein